VESKNYFIAGRSFQLKDLTLKEAEAVNKIFKSLAPGSHDNEVVADLSNDEAREFLSIALTPKVEPSFFDDATEEQFIEVFKDFFLARLNQKKNITTFFSGLIKKLN